jgi:serine/threonine protein kinase
VLIAIAELHTHLICHKDIKPENILLTHTKPQASV